MKNNLVSELKTARRNLIRAVNNFPEKQRSQVLFDKWSLNDILNHLIGWANHQIKTLRELREYKKISLADNLKNKINEDFVSENRGVKWETVYDDFVKISQQLIDEYEGLPKDLWNKKIWPGKEITPKEYIKLEINHYKDTHAPQIDAIASLQHDKKDGFYRPAKRGSRMTQG